MTFGAAIESGNNFQDEIKSITSPKILRYDLPGQITESKNKNSQNTAKIFDDLIPIREFNNASAETSGFADSAKSLFYPFKFKASLIFGAIFFTIFWLGQSVWVFGGFMLVSAIFCAMLANTLTFGILANTVEISQTGKLHQILCRASTTFRRGTM